MPSAPRTRVLIADRTAASSGPMTRSRSVSVLDGAMDSRGTSSPVAGSRYWTRLWCDSSVSSSMRMPVWRRTSMAAHPQNALSSSRFRLRRLPVAGSSAQARGDGLARRVRRSCWPPAVNVSPIGVARAACSRAAASLRPRSTAAARAGRTGSRSRVRASMRALVRVFCFLYCRSPARTGQGTAQGPQRAGSSSAHWARSR